MEFPDLSGASAVVLEFVEYSSSLSKKGNDESYETKY
jgi:hypothetical protein